MAGELAETTASSDFAEMIQAVQRAPASEARSAAESVANVDRVKANGIAVPESFRITMRTFESPEPPRSPQELQRTVYKRRTIGSWRAADLDALARLLASTAPID